MGENNLPRLIVFVENGEELLGYLHGRENPHKRKPILTTSKVEESIVTAYHLGVNSFICKPVRFKELVEIAREIGNYWFGTVALPKI